MVEIRIGPDIPGFLLLNHAPSYTIRWVSLHIALEIYRFIGEDYEANGNFF